MTENGHPTRDELLVMAYVDDELAAEARSDFQARLANEPELVRQVAVYQKLEGLARQMGSERSAKWLVTRTSENDARLHSVPSSLRAGTAMSALPPGLVAGLCVSAHCGASARPTPS